MSTIAQWLIGLWLRIIGGDVDSEEEEEDVTDKDADIQITAW